MHSLKKMTSQRPFKLAAALYSSQTSSQQGAKLKFNYQDPLLIEDLLTDEEKMIRDTVRKYCKEKLQPRASDCYMNEYFDPTIMKELGDLGLIGANFKEYNLPGISSVAQGLIEKELDKVDSGLRSSYAASMSLCMYPIYRFANKSVKDVIIPKMASGDMIGAFALTEPNHGSDPSSMESRVKTKDGYYVLSGQKTWITNAPIADVFVAWAKDENNEIRGFVLTKDMKGLETTKIQNKLSLRASSTGMVFMDNVEVPNENLLNTKGMKGVFNSLDEARMGIAWGAIGSAEACFEQALDYTLNRKQFGRPLAQTQLIQLKLADMVTEMALSMQSLIRVAHLKDEGKLAHEAVSILKRNNCRQALLIARKARDMLGGNGIVEEYGVMRHLLNLETLNTYEGTYDIHGLILGKAITGYQSFA